MLNALSQLTSFIKREMEEYLGLDLQPELGWLITVEVLDGEPIVNENYGPTSEENAMNDPVHEQLAYLRGEHIFSDFMDEDKGDIDDCSDYFDTNKENS